MTNIPHPYTDVDDPAFVRRDAQWQERLAMMRACGDTVDFAETICRIHWQTACLLDRPEFQDRA